MIEQQIEISTADGRMDTFVCHPERGGPFPAILFFMDAPGIREELRDMVRRLATTGYFVLLPNLYYRAGVGELGPIPQHEESTRRKRMFELMAGIDVPLVAGDTVALLAYAAGSSAASAGPAGCVGYCMSGRYAVSAAHAHPDRIRAAASIHGTHLVTDRPDSIHLMAQRTNAELYFACAEIDRWAPREAVDELRRTLTGSGANAEVEFYPGVEHGFVFPQRPAYDKPAAERHWERLFSLFGRNLGQIPAYQA